VNSVHNKILVVDDEPHILNILEFLLMDEGYRVTTVETGEEALEVCDENNFDLVVLDLALPGIDGFTVCRTMQKKGVPILMLSSHDEEEYVIAGLETGALDYVRKPFNHRELILRISNLIGRKSRESNPTRLCSGHIEINLESEQVLCRGEMVRLTPTEYLLLVLLMQKQGAVASWEEILQKVWGSEEWDGAKQLIKVNIRRLRTKVESNPREPELIVSQWGRGYRFSEKVTLL